MALQRTRGLAAAQFLWFAGHGLAVQDLRGGRSPLNAVALDATPRLGVLVLLVALGAAGCNLCGNEVVARVASPDGERAAVVFQRSCGATTPFTTQVSVVKGNRSVSGVGNVFVADTNHGGAKPASWGGPGVAVEWISGTRLRIQHDPRARISKREQRIGEVTVEYRAGV